MELHEFCVTSFPDHCAGVVSVSGTLDVEAIKSQLAAQGVDPNTLRARYQIQQTIAQPDGSGVQVVTPDASRARKALRQFYGPAVTVVEPGP